MKKTLTVLIIFGILLVTLGGKQLNFPLDIITATEISPPSVTFTVIENNSVAIPGTTFMLSVTSEIELYEVVYNWNSTNVDFLRFLMDGKNMSASFAEYPPMYYHVNLDVPIFHGWHQLNVYATNLNSDVTIVSLNMFVNPFIENKAPVISTDLPKNTIDYPRSSFTVMCTDDYGWNHYKMHKWNNNEWEIRSYLISGLGSVGGSEGYELIVPQISGFHNYSVFVNDTLGSASIDSSPVNADHYEVLFEDNPWLKKESSTSTNTSEEVGSVETNSTSTSTSEEGESLETNETNTLTSIVSGNGLIELMGSLAVSWWVIVKRRRISSSSLKGNQEW